MTAWQDQPPLSNKPLSRRQVRESERGEITDGQVDTARITAEHPDFTGFPREGWEAEARRMTADNQSPVGRRAQRSAQPAEAESYDRQPAEGQPLTRDEQRYGSAEAEPLEYVTQTRPQTPTDDGLQLRRRPVSAVDNEFPNDASGYRAREFSPEGRPSFTSTEPESGQLPHPASEELLYRTQGAGEHPAQVEPQQPSQVQSSYPPAAPADVTRGTHAPVEGRTHSRRELRAMEANQAALAGLPSIFDPFVQAVVQDGSERSPQALVEPERSPQALVEPERSPQSPVEPERFVPALVQPEQPMRRSRTRELSTEQDYRLTEATTEFDLLANGATAAAPALPVEPLALIIPSAPVQPFEAPTSALLPPTPQSSTGVNLFDALFSTPTEESTPTSGSTPAKNTSDIDAQAFPAEASAWTPPTGHWSTQAMIDDDEQIQENTVSRNIGATSGAITTNALVLPMLPVDDMTRPLGSTGEILITGIIDLPRAFGTTGAVPALYDHSDVDTLLEASDREDADASPDSAPVRAIRAVNTHTSTLGTMETKRPKGISRLPLIIGVAATTLAVGVVVLVVAAMVFGVFK